MHKLNTTTVAMCLLVLLFSVTELFAQTCTLSVTGLNRYRYVSGPVATECGNNLHSAPFGNWGVTSTVGKKQDGHQFDGWCHDSWVCDNWGNCTTACQDGWYEWNSCTSVPRFAAPNCTLYNAASCTRQYTTQDIDNHGTVYLNIPTSCPMDTNGDQICDTGGCSAFTSYTQPNHFMSLYELDPFGTDSLVQTVYFPAMTVPLTCNPWGCGIAGSQWVNPWRYQSPVEPAKVYVQAAIAVGWGSFSDPNRVCRSYAAVDPRYNCY